MAVKVGSARIDERGKATGGMAGDQTGSEVSTQNWYLHQKGWNVFRCKDPVAGAMVAEAMMRACDNPNIGYDQNQRLSLYDAAAKVSFDPKLVNVKCETDCSALVRVCLAFAGIKVANFRTSTQKNILLNSGEIIQMVGAKYEKSSDYLKAGDILCTKTQGHTVVVLNNGKYAGQDTVVIPKEYTLGQRILRNGDIGADVAEMQTHLIDVGFDCGRYGIDGEFGDDTEMAVEAFQRSHGCEPDGEYGPITHAALMEAAEKKNNQKPPENPKFVYLAYGDSYVRKAPDTSAGKIGVANRYTEWPYAGKTSENGWYAIDFNGWNGWVSGKYSVLEE